MVFRMARYKSSTILTIAFGAIFICLSAVFVLIVDAFVDRHAIDEAEQRARVLQDKNLAIHQYYSEILKPRLFALTDPYRSPDYFDPSWMSSSYAVRRIQENFNALNPTGYMIRDAAINARNPANEADDIERRFLADVNADPKLMTRSFTREFGGVPYLVFLRRGETLVSDCLRCHGDPAAAPGDLVALYGDTRGFHREGEVGKVISAISIRIPLASAFADVAQFSAALSTFLILALAAFFILQALLANRLLYAPIAALRAKALEIAADETKIGERVPIPPGKELADLAGAFNSMSTALKLDRDQLEDRIGERSAELTDANERLAQDVETRKKTEELLQKALAENRALYRELQHRAKNTLGLISSLIGMASIEDRTEETQKLLAELHRRVDAISQLYSMLYSSGNVEEVRLDDYCVRIVAALEGLDDLVEMQVELEPVVVQAGIAAPIGLIVTELVTNSLKHAFAADQAGTIRISLSTSGREALLEVADDGKGMPQDTAAQPPGTGSAILYGLVEQIGGHLEVRSDGSGTRVAMSFPV